MAQVNPYASQLGSESALQVIAGTPEKLAGLVGSRTEAQLERRPAPEKWSIRELLCHLADAEIAFAFRIRQTLAEPHHTIQPFDQDRWASSYGRLAAQDALRTFRALRQWNVALLKTLEPQALEKPVTHPERGGMTLRTIVETMGGHDKHHIKQIEKAEEQ